MFDTYKDRLDYIIIMRHLKWWNHIRLLNQISFLNRVVFLPIILAFRKHFTILIILLLLRSCLIPDKRVPYKSQADVLLEEDIIKEPIKMFTKWFKLASETPGILEANAMNLATSTKQVPTFCIT